MLTSVSTAMDSTSQQQQNQQSVVEISDEDGIEGDSSSTTSGASETESANEQSSDHLMMESISASPVNNIASSPFHGNNGSSVEGDHQQLLHHTTANSRANFSQFETPADETRNNFGPDDFDEQLFIGQLATNCTETRRFDEELEPQVIMDTADHSESSDVEDMFTNGSHADKLALQSDDDKTYNKDCSNINNVDIDDSSSSCFPRSPTSHHHHPNHHQSSRLHKFSSRLAGGPSGGKRKCSRGQRHVARLLEKQVPSPQLDLLFHKNEEETEEFDQDHMEHLNEEDLSCDNALDTESLEEENDNHHHHHHIPNCLNFTNREEDDDEENEEEEQSTSRSCISVDGLKSSPMRKRKGEMPVDSPDETHPLKKPVTDDDVDEVVWSVPNHSILSGVMEDSDRIHEEIHSPNEDLRLGEEEMFGRRHNEEVDESPYSCNDEDGMNEDCSSVPNGCSIRSIIPSRTHPPPRLEEWLEIFSGWSHPERLMAITELIGLCEATQVRHMMQIIEPQFQRDFISLLPKELALYVLSFLDPRDLLRAAQTCKYWRILADDNLLWREKCKEAGIGYFSAMSNRVHRRSRNNTNAHSSTASNDVPNTRWKAAFMKQHYVEVNWKRKDTRDHKILKGHDDHVITCLQFSGNRIVSGSDDNTLKVWSANTGKCLRTLLGHTGGVWSSQMSGTTIVSGSTDRTLRVWNAETGQCLHTLYGHTSTVRCMHLHGKKVVSGSRDATLRMWDVETGECLHVLVGHMAAVRCVQYNGHLVVSGAYDYMVRIWDPEREECLHQLSGHTNRVYSLQFDGIHVVSGSLDTSIRVWDVETGACKHTLMGHQSLTSGMELRDNLLVSGNADSTVKIWDISTGQCLLTLTGPNKHLSAVTCLQLINKFVITSSDDGTVKLWDIRSGDFVRNLVSLSSGGSGGVVWRIRASETKLVCAVGSRNGTEETKLLVLDFDTDAVKTEPKVEVKTELQLDI